MIPLDEYFDDVPEKNLFHYTGISSLLGIAKSESLWASSVYYLNDGEEILYAQKKLISSIEKKIESSEGNIKGFLIEFSVWLKAFIGGGFNLFAFSLSEEKSQLSQWRSYTPHGKGISIEFTPHIINKIIQKNDLKICRVRYENFEQEEVIESLLEQVISTFLSEERSIETENRPLHQKYLMYLEKFRGDVLQVFSTIKHPAFKEEKEWRLISKYFASYVSPEIKYREGASMLVPYVELKLERYHGIPQHTHAVYFKSVCLGPSAHAGLSFNALSQFLSNQKISHETSNSNIPYREW